MTRIAVIGNAGGGKSTVSRNLSTILGLPLHPMDRLQWRPGWRPVPKEEMAPAHTKLLAASRWIIDGWGDFDAIAERFERADTIILVDYPLWRHYWWATKRQFMCLFRPRIDGPPGCPMLPMTWQLLRMIWAIDKHAMPRVRAMVEQEGSRKRIFHIRTLDDLRSCISNAESCAKRNA